MDQTKGIRLTIVHCAIELSSNEDTEVKLIAPEVTSNLRNKKFLFLFFGPVKF